MRGRSSLTSSAGYAPTLDGCKALGAKGAFTSKTDGAISQEEVAGSAKVGAGTGAI